MLNPQRNANLQKRKFEVGIVTLTLFLCVVGLLGMSIMSFFQTEFAFMPLNDPTMIFQGIQFGSMIAFLCALIFQYGQNAALYVKNHYTTGKVVINLFGMFDIKDTTICWMVFWICAAIDAGTNCLWLYNQPDIRKQNPIFQTVEYSAMIMIVGVEEVLGIVLQAFMHSFTTWKQITVSTKGESERKNNNSDGSNRYREPEFSPTKNPKSNYQPKNKPGNSKHGTSLSDLIPSNKSFGPPQKNKNKQEPTYQNLMPAKPVENWQDEAKREQERWTKRDLYDKNMGDMEEFPE